MTKTTPCQNCNTARDHVAYALFCPSCIHCGARLIQRLALLPIAVSECSARRKAMLKVWTDYGHSEAEIRRLVKGAVALQPLPTGPEKATASALPSPRKRR